MYSEYEEIEKFLSYETENYVSLKEKLNKRGIDRKTALICADKFKKRFYELINEKKINSYNISGICYNLENLVKTDTDKDTLFLYTALLGESCLLFGNVENNEQKIALWLEHSEKVYGFTTLINKERENYKVIKNLIKNINYDNTAVSYEYEQKILYHNLLEYDIFYKERNNYIFYENIGELIHIVNSNNVLKKIKPYIFSSILFRKQRKIIKQKGYMPNIENIFVRKDYNINVSSMKKKNKKRKSVRNMV